MTYNIVNYLFYMSDQYSENDDFDQSFINAEAAKLIDRTHEAIRRYIEATVELDTALKNPETTPEELENAEYEIDRYYDILTYYAKDHKYGHTQLSETTKTELAKARNSEDILARLKRARSSKASHKKLLDDVILEVMNLREELRDAREEKKWVEDWFSGLLDTYQDAGLGSETLDKSI